MLTLGVAAAPAQAESPADWMYEPTTFTEVRLQLPPASYEFLEEHPEDEYVQGTFSIAETNGAPGSATEFSPPIEVGIRLKGSLGSLRSINEKAAFKIKFDEFVPGQTFDGLEKMTLNNMVQDPSMTHEALAYRAFHEMGVYAPHVGFSYLWVNGKSYGLHLNVETQDKIALEKQFGPFQSPPQHLYEGEYGADVSNGSWQGTATKAWEKLEVDEGKKKEKGDLTTFLAAVEGSGGSFSERVANYADLPEMTRMWMVEKYIGHWDGYAGQSPDNTHPNNYYLYSDPAGKFQVFPWGTDQTWGDHLNFEAPGGHLFADCMGDASCSALFRQAGEKALGTINVASFDKAARCTASDVQPWREYEDASSEAQKQPPYSLAQTATAQKSSRDFIASRPAELASFLGVSTPAPGKDESACPPLRPVGGFPKPPPPVGNSTVTVVIPGAPAASVALGRRSADARAVTLQLNASAAGRVVLLGTFATANGRAAACRGEATATAAGALTVPCKLTAAFKRRLADHAAYMRLTATLTPATGAAHSAVTTLRLARR